MGFGNKAKGLKKGGRNKHGAIAAERDGIVFPSQLERRAYDLLKKFKIPFKMQHRIELQDKFRCRNGVAIKCVFMKVDYYLDLLDTPYGKVVYLDPKGEYLDYSRLKYKMLQYQLEHVPDDEFVPYEVLMPHTDRQVDSVILNIKSILDGKNKV